MASGYRYDKNISYVVRIMDYRTSQSPSQVFGIGLGKTGTTSLNEALNILGYRSKHYPLDLHYINNGTYNAATDSLIALKYKELYETFPNAKFIYTLRNISDWLVSFENHFTKQPVINLSENLVAMKLRQDLYGTVVFDKESYRSKFTSHIQEVLRFFEEKRNLKNLTLINIFDHSSAANWRNICTFLKCDVPPVNFPHLNK